MKDNRSTLANGVRQTFTRLSKSKFNKVFDYKLKQRVADPGGATVTNKNSDKILEILKIFLELKKTDIVVNKKFFNTKRRPDYRIDKYKLIFEYDGPDHYRNPFKISDRRVPVPMRQYRLPASMRSSPRRRTPGCATQSGACSRMPPVGMVPGCGPRTAGRRRRGRPGSHARQDDQRAARPAAADPPTLRARTSASPWAKKPSEPNIDWTAGSSVPTTSAIWSVPR